MTPEQPTLHNGDDLLQRRLAQALTTVLQPNILQVVLLLVFAWPDLMAAQSYSLIALVVLFSMVLPLVGYVLYLKSAGVKVGFSLAREYRLIPFLINNVSLALFVFTLRYLFLDDPETRRATFFLFLGVGYLLALNIVAAAVTLFYKLSLHMMALGAMSILLYTRSSSEVLSLKLILLFWLLVALAWARLRLKAHTADEVVTGMALGMLLPVLILMLPWDFPL